MTIIIQLVLGFGLLYAGATVCLKGAVRLALGLRVSKMLIGLTIIAFGTSLPEGCVSIVAAFNSNSVLALGNVLGSNIANVGLVLGSAALIKPLNIGKSFSRNELYFVALGGVLFPLMMLNATLGRGEGVILLVLFGCFMYMLFHDEHARAAVEGEINDDEKPVHSIVVNVVYVVVGIALLLTGAILFVRGAVSCAHYFGLPEWVIGITLVAVGTSIPELATAIAASVKNEAGLVVGNILGSNVMNFFLILALAALISPITIHDDTFVWQLCFFLFFSIVPIPVVLTGGTISRTKGALLLGMYAGYIYWIKCALM